MRLPARYRPVLLVLLLGGATGGYWVSGSHSKDPAEFRARARPAITDGSRLGAFSSLAFSPLAPVLVGGSWDGALRLWDTNSLRMEGWLAGHGQAVSAVTFSRDGKLLVTA